MAERREMTAPQSLLPEIDRTPETRLSTPATVMTRGGGASAANRRQTEHGRGKSDGRRVSPSSSKKGGKYDSELELLTVERGILAERGAAVTAKGHQAREMGQKET
jgi:hypothetical protein